MIAALLVICAAVSLTVGLGHLLGARSERRLTAHLFQESALEHDRLTRQLETVRRQLAAAVVRSVDGP